jgi:hypothetical protein
VLEIEEAVLVRRFVNRQGNELLVIYKRGTRPKEG